MEGHSEGHGGDQVIHEEPHVGVVVVQAGVLVGEVVAPPLARLESGVQVRHICLRERPGGLRTAFYPPEGGVRVGARGGGRPMR
jgi:hypothetical protein